MLPTRLFCLRYVHATDLARVRLTEEEKALILESVNNALADPLNMTPSQYTAAP